MRYEDLGSPEFQVHTRKFARELRKSLWRKHFGFEVSEAGYSKSTDRVPPEFAPVKIPQHPPRLTMTPAAFLKGQREVGVAWSQVLAKPCDPQTVAAIQSIGSSNKKAYEAVFTHIPRNEFETFQEGRNSFTEPYPCAVAGRAVQGELRAEEINDRVRRANIANMQSPYRAQAASGLDQLHRRETRRIVNRTLGVIPPPLAEAFMTRTLMPHQKDEVINSQSTARRYITYEGRVHDIERAIRFLKGSVAGFLVLAPLRLGQRRCA